MNFLDDLKCIKKEMQRENKNSVLNHKNLKSTQNNEKKIDEQDKFLEEIFLKEKKLINEFQEFINNSDIKKIY
ncbi:hypothetical protein DU472_02500 [Campylobacter novaezeelandiae]|uniref:hypothetical protein n=1 Tax=Campylobacter novaezeelandiae TaxID=2267891 RepID=UPI00103749F6|nr:hypothetical protein [Campylobacter novaezeelandiae]QWU80098.1 hypothetical protein CNZW441b_0781 [Campylobacter novaezeelandiae]TBR78986.1 hypothetical protein DU474_04365 [Campylobacter novaezeelandiae]TBR81585.1 hypothetical protein DU472_02500 [Campylobacter novaezeelandiae]